MRHDLGKQEARWQPPGRRLTLTRQHQCRKMGWCSRKEFFDELADNLEARSDRYTHQSGPGIIALF